MLGMTLERLSQTCGTMPQLRKADVSAGDWVIIRTVKSEYRLRVLEGGLFEAAGGWFETKGGGSMIIGVSGATWGGSAILPQVIAACGMRVEFQNRLITSPVRSIIVLPRAGAN